MSSRSLADLRPAFRARAVAWLDQCIHAGLDVLVTCTYRSMAEQADLYARGRTAPGKKVTNAKPGQSAHNYGLALDFVPMINGKPEWSAKDPAWGQAITLAESQGMESLAHDPKFAELAHLQEPNWRDIVT